MDFIALKSKPEHWFNPKLLYSKTTTTAKCLGFVNWVRNQPLSAFIVLVRQTNKQRQSLTFKGKKRQSKSNHVHVKRAQDPWVLIAALSLQKRTPKQIVKIYKTRMQIEEGFRDSKAVHYGLCLSQNCRMNPCRRSVLCLITACTIFVLQCNRFEFLYFMINTWLFFIYNKVLHRPVELTAISRRWVYSKGLTLWHNASHDLIT